MYLSVRKQNHRVNLPTHLSEIDCGVSAPVPGANRAPGYGGLVGTGVSPVAILGEAETEIDPALASDADSELTSTTSAVPITIAIGLDKMVALGGCGL